MADPGKTDGPDDFRAVKGMDPAANWLLRFGVDDYLPEGRQTLIPLLIELREDAVGPFKDLVERREGAQVLGFGPGNDFIRADTLLPVIVTLDWLERLLDGSPESARFLDADKRIVLSSPLDRPDSLGRGPLPSPRLDVRASAASASGDVVVAAIDDGFAFAHERFRTDQRLARIEAFWDMNQGFPYPSPSLGELTNIDIDNLTAATTVGGVVDEEAIYARAGLLDYASPRHKPLAWRASHGTHVLDLAAGTDPGTDGPPVIAVQLPSPVVARTTGELLDFYVWLGMLYILYVAGRRPVVINISFGYDAGPHDGEGLLEKYLSRLVGDRDRTAVVLPAGNAQLSRCHATIDLDATPEVTLEWIVQPEDRTHSVIEIWLPTDSPPGDRMTVTVVQPDGTADTLAEVLSPPAPLSHAGRVMGLLELWERQDGRRMFRIAIAPTARPQPNPRAVAPAGAWTLRFARGGMPMETPAHAWVQRDDSLYGYPQRGRQSYFEHDAYARFDALGYAMDDDPPPAAPPCPITRTSLLNAIATSPNVVVAGGFRSRDCRIARYSAGGPNTPAENPPLKKPDVLLPSDGSPAHPGVLAAGARSGARLAMDGTSVASPQLARYIAGWLAVAADPGRPAVRAAPDPAFRCQIPVSSERDGHGRLDRLDQVLARFEPGD